MGWFDERFDERQSRLRLDCSYCGRAMWYPPSKHGLYKTCGEDCARGQRLRQIELRARSCATCGGKFVPRPGQIRKGHGFFCSQACNTNAREALGSVAAQQRARLKRRSLEAAGLVKHRRGSEHPFWKGGPEAARKRNLERVADYKRSHPEKVRVWNANRRLKELGRIDANTIKVLLAAQRRRCAACRCQLQRQQTHLDHIEPISKGGAHTRSNVQLLCKRCNLHKAAKDPIAFMQSMGFLL